jgi:hypothetical protein
MTENIFLKNIYDQYEDEFGKAGAKIGTTFRIRLPNDFVIRDGPKMPMLTDYSIVNKDIAVPATLAIAMGVTAVAVKNPVVSRRFWDWRK